MNKRWIDIYNDEEAYKFSRRWIEAIQEIESNGIISFSINNNKIFNTENENVFWADEIKKYAENPDKRLEYAINNLPLPHAFKEAMIATRGIIKIKRKQNIDTEYDYTILYKIGVVSSMCLQYSYLLKEPGFNIFERIPGGMLFELETPYSVIGYKEIDIFNKTDCKWFVNIWGEPKKHQTMNTYYSDIWNKYELILKEDRKRDFDERVRRVWEE